MWTSQDISNLIHEVIVGLIMGIVASYFAAFFYERQITKRRKRELFNKYSFLQSDENKFDWQHWNVNAGKVAEDPIESYMTLTYKEGKTFSFRWGDKKTADKGSGFIFWDDVFHGKMSFFEIEKNWFDHRNVYYAKIIHQEKEYDAIFINADDQRTKYVMLRGRPPIV